MSQRADADAIHAGLGQSPARFPESRPQKLQAALLEYEIPSALSDSCDATAREDLCRHVVTDNLGQHARGMVKFLRLSTSFSIGTEPPTKLLSHLDGIVDAESRSVQAARMMSLTRMPSYSPRR